LVTTAKLKPLSSPSKRKTFARAPQSLFGYLGRVAFNWPQRLALRHWDQIAFAGRLLLSGLWGNRRLKSRRQLSRRLFLQETWLLFQTTGALMILIGLLAGFFWDAIWFGVLDNIGGAERLISLVFSIHLQEITPILASAVITMGHGVPMTVSLAMRKCQGDFATMINLGVPVEHYLAWPRLLGGVVGLPILYLLMSISFLLGLYLGARLFFGLSPWDFMNLANASLVDFKFLKLGAKCLLVGFCLNFFCLYRSWQVKKGQLRAIPRCARWAMAETFLYSIISVILVTVLYD
jgi:ABC-type transporter Mla maintaining outer membrane lipid asymmetry permease subunit MlaE